MPGGAASAAASVVARPYETDLEALSNFSPVMAPCGEASTLSMNWSGSGTLVTST